MTTPDIARLHQRIDELVEKIGELSSAVAKSLATCDSCRPFVLGGNGNPPLADRIGQVQQEISESESRTEREDRQSEHRDHGAENGPRDRRPAVLVGHRRCRHHLRRRGRHSL